MTTGANHDRTGRTSPILRDRIAAAATRAAGFFFFWLVLAGPHPADGAAGIVAAIAATWASLWLMPQRASAKPLAAAGFVLHFAKETVIAGTDVARRALDPRMPLRPGFVAFPTSFPPGASRDTFCAITSLLPGTLPSGTVADGLLIHCLDVSQPVARQLADEEARIERMLGGADDD